MIRGLEVGVPYTLFGEVLYAARISVCEGATLPALVAPSGTDDVTAQTVRYAIKKDGSLYEVYNIQREPVLRVDMLPTEYTVGDLVAVDLDDDALLADMYDTYVGKSEDEPMHPAVEAYAEYVDGVASELLADVSI